MNVFVSRPTWIDPRFEVGVRTLLTQLRNLGLEPRTLGVSDYPSQSPLDEVIRLMKVCRGAIILGVPQLIVRSGALKGSEIVEPFELATEWNQLEGALAYSSGLPVLVMHHNTVRRGLFDRGVMNAFLHSVDMADAAWSMNEDVNGAILGWRSNCEQGISNRPTEAAIEPPSNVPACPNCSSGSKKQYMRPIPPPFSELAGGVWECSVCGFVKQ